LNENKVKEIKERYDGFIDESIPKFHYGSHYSSVGSVLYYLIRCEPFSYHNTVLQGGQFDLADRLFYSIESTWNNIMSSISDCKELIPEFFYFPEFLKNVNHIDLGTKQTKEKVDHVILPKWAESPEHFIRMNRDALESDFVSSHLHEWIDLIFGFKQRGTEAVKALNIFYYLTYEGVIDIDDIKDPMIKASVETQISNFGQTPSQLFTKPHPKRDRKKLIPTPLYWNPTNDVKPFYKNQILDKNQPIVFVHYENEKNYILNTNRELHVYHWMKMKPNVVLNVPIGIPYASDAFINSSCFGIIDKWIFSCGHFDKSIKISNLSDNLKVVTSIFDHKDIVTCLKVTPKSRLLLSGSKDCTVKMWSIVPSGGKQFEYFPLLTLYGHESPIISLDVNEDLDVVISGDIMGICLIHDLRNGNLIRKILHPNGNKQLNLVRISRDGNILIHSFEDQNLYLFTINGMMLHGEMMNDYFHSIEILENSKYFICGGNNKVVSIKNLFDFKNVQVFEKTSHSIRCMTFKSKNEFMVGLGDGSLNGYQVENELFENVHLNDEFQIISSKDFQ
jgi:WD40 repeat protein